MLSDHHGRVFSLYLRLPRLPRFFPPRTPNLRNFRFVGRMIWGRVPSSMKRAYATLVPTVYLNALSCRTFILPFNRPVSTGTRRWALVLTAVATARTLSSSARLNAALSDVLTRPSVLRVSLLNRTLAPFSAGPRNGCALVPG